MSDKLLIYTPHISQVIRQTLLQFKNSNNQFGQKLIDSAMDLSVAGKMMRGNIVCASYAALTGKKVNQKVIQVAAGLELIGSGILVLDDVIDQDIRRRGLSTLHYFWQEYAQTKKYFQPEHIGRSYGLCLSDILVFLGQKLISQSQIETKKILDILNISLEQMLFLEVIEAEEMEVAAEQKMPSRQKIESIYVGKTANYSLVWPFQLGSILAGTSPSIQAKIVAVARDIGLLFQIKDDWLGIYGDPQITGKSNTSDVANRKKTWILHQLGSFGKSNVEIINKYIRSNNPKDEKIILKLLHDPKFIQFIDKKIKRKHTQSIKKITGYKFKPYFENILLELNNFVINRVK